MPVDGRPRIDQKALWNQSFHDSGAFFGAKPSDFCKQSLTHFKAQNVRSVLELGSGQGRDTIAFAQAGLTVAALDYSATAVSDTQNLAAAKGVAELVLAQTHDLRKALPFPDGSFDACYSHMLLCMELSTAEIAFVMREVHRVLKPGGLVLYSVRSNFDKYFGKGISHGDDLFEIGDFVVHFFSTAKIRQLAKGFEVESITRLAEGHLPRDLFCVTLRKATAPTNWTLDPLEETEMNDPLDQFQVFMDGVLAPGVLDNKTKQLVALAAALAAGCDP